MATSDKDGLYRLAANGSGDKLRSALKQHKDIPSESAHVDSVRKEPNYSNPYQSYNKSSKDAEPQGLTLLHEACSNGNVSCVKTLLELGASPSVRTPTDADYFDIACACGWSTALGEEICLHLAAASGSGAVVDLLLSAGAEVNARSANGCTPLMTATNRYKMWYQLCSPKANDKEEGEEGEGRGSKEEQDHGRKNEHGRAEAEEEDGGGEDTLALTAFQQQASEAVMALIQAGADMDARCEDVHRYSLHARQPTPHTVQMMRQRLRARVTVGMTALHWAVNTGDYGIARSLVAAGADVDACTKSDCSPGYIDTNQTPLHFAVELGDAEMVQLLLAGGGNVNKKDGFAMTPLHQVFAVSEETYEQWNCWGYQSRPLPSVKSDRLRVATLLLKAGAVRDQLADVAESPIDKNRRVRQGKEKPEPKYDTVSSLAELNPTTGGPEVVKMLASVVAEPRSLQSSCRLAIRKHLSRPILRQSNVDLLPLPVGLKNYVAMVTL